MKLISNTATLKKETQISFLCVAACLAFFGAGFIIPNGEPLLVLGSIFIVVPFMALMSIIEAYGFSVHKDRNRWAAELFEVSPEVANLAIAGFSRHVYYPSGGGAAIHVELSMSGTDGEKDCLNFKIQGDNPDGCENKDNTILTGSLRHNTLSYTLHDKALTNELKYIANILRDAIVREIAKSAEISASRLHGLKMLSRDVRPGGLYDKHFLARQLKEMARMFRARDSHPDNSRLSSIADRAERISLYLSGNEDPGANICGLLDFIVPRATELANARDPGKLLQISGKLEGAFDGIEKMIEAADETRKAGEILALEMAADEAINISLAATEYDKRKPFFTNPRPA